MRDGNLGRLIPLVTVAALALAACSSGDDSTKSAPTGVEPTDVTGDAAPAGAFVVEYEQPTTDEGRSAMELLQRSAVLEQAVDVVNRHIAVPEDIPIVVGDAIELDGEPMEGPAAIATEIVFPTQFVTETGEDLSAVAEPDDTEDDIVDATADTARFAALHEMGHVLVRQLDLPIAGQEEDAVDGFALVMLVAGIEDVDHVTEPAAVTLAAADSFEASSFEPDDADWWDEHTLNQQRARTLVCLAAGSSDDAFAALEEVVPEERLIRCPEEYRQTLTSWLRLLEGHYRAEVEEQVEQVLTSLNDAATQAAEQAS